MTLSLSSKLAAISAVQLMCMIAAAGQERVNPQAEALAGFSKRVTSYLSLQKKVEGTLASQKETNDPEKIKQHITSLATGIRAARADAKPGDIFNGASEQFRHIIKEDAHNRSVRDAFAAMQEVPKKNAARVNADYPETAALATVPPLILNRLQRLPDGLEYRFMGRDLILRDTKANLIVDVLHEAVPTVGR
ncbi:MAG: hypothetical protein JWL71_4426 [Acidobacteria bacterium]|nr:hypothetical protein [Acidobacteriota bacterium]